MVRLFGLVLLAALILSITYALRRTSICAQPFIEAFAGDATLWSIAIASDRSAELEQLTTRVGDALMKLEKPCRESPVAEWKAGWKVVRGISPMKYELQRGSFQQISTLALTRY